MTKTVVLPLPDRRLSPNQQGHWRPKAAAKKKARSWGAKLASWLKGKRFSSYQLHFYWKDKRRRDQDNASASCKAYLDGISDAVGQDDSEWLHNGVRFHLDKENPRLEVVFELSEEDPPL